MGINQIWCVIPIIFVSMASIHNARLFDIYGVRSPFLGEVHALPPSCFVPSSVYRWWDHCAMPPVSPAIIHLAGVALVLAGTHLLPGPEKQCSMNCLAQGHNEPEHRQIVEPESWPGCWSRVPHANTRPTRQLNADRDYLNMIGNRLRIYHVQLSWMVV